MKKACTGIDIIEIDRIRDAVGRWGERFLTRIYTENELALYRNKQESLAAGLPEKKRS
jgi:holo-[acyl-carrier protein] synthase